ncbi:MAG: hypothetical protein ACRD3B_19325, partial [Candidatus Sulfotelmatobacter sp.]
MNNTQKMYKATRALVGKIVSARAIRVVTQQMYPGTPDGSLLVSDHSRVRDANGRLVRKATQSATYADGLFEAVATGYRVLPEIEIQKKSETPGTRMQSPISSLPLASAVPPVLRVGTPAKPNRQLDHTLLVATLRRLAPSLRKSSDRAWVREPAVRVIDCVLSLMRRYDAFVVPRLDEFERRYPDVRTVSDLYRLIASFQCPDRFVIEVLDYRHEDRAETLAGVVNWLVTVSGEGAQIEQISNLGRWASAAHPSDHTTLGIHGFGLGGFQYLRMLFGANTTKPDVHICRFVASSVGHRVSDIEALDLL